MKHDKIFDGLLELENKVNSLQNFIIRMEMDNGSPSEDKMKDVSEWNRMTFKEFIDDGAKKIIAAIIITVDETTGRLKEMIDGGDEPNKFENHHQ